PTGRAGPNAPRAQDPARCGSGPLSSAVRSRNNSAASGPHQRSSRHSILEATRCANRARAHPPTWGPVWRVSNTAGRPFRAFLEDAARSRIRYVAVRVTVAKAEDT